ncbi:hypothetical protein M422DRAFT_244597 [Sphaerobolus stellatus SS14]|nr:hypothetical protein M422DRAFT_244597 [Sphaerobolus stellatus SS14]
MRDSVHDNPDPASMPVRTLRTNASSASPFVFLAPRLPPTGSVASSPLLPAGKGGCWTCRLRRKAGPRPPAERAVSDSFQKCDEQVENGACHTCRRLRIECLGWGARRPDWMRDKTKVEAYKAGIKRQLSSQGMIRGQPRTAANPPPVNASPIQYPYPDTRFNQPATDTGSDENEDFYRGQSLSAGPSPAYATVQMPQLTPDGLSHGLSALDLRLFPTPGISNVPLPSSAFSAASPHLIGGDISAMPYVPSHTYYSPSINHSPLPRRNENQNSEYIEYFFRRVQSAQFIFQAGSPALEPVFRDIVSRNPEGPIAKAMCAFAALHQSQVRVAEGIEDPAAENSLHSIAVRFYDEAWWQLVQTRQHNRQYSDTEATVAIQLTSFCLYANNGSSDWRRPFQVACEWLQSAPISMVQNPRYQWLSLNSLTRFTAQMTMWFDILSSVLSNKTPRFMDLYRRLFRIEHHTQNFWQNSPHTHVQNLHMDTLTGCPDSIMYALAETAALAHWKAQQTQNCALSVRELNRRADIIEQGLRSAYYSPASTSSAGDSGPGGFPQLLDFGYDSHGGAGAGMGTINVGGVRAGQHHHSPVMQGHHHAGSHSVHHSPIVHNGGELHGNGVGMGHASAGSTTPVSPSYNSHQVQLIANAFFEHALLYLSSVVSGHFPAVPEISDSVASVISALQKVDSTDPSRGLVLIIGMTACLTDNPEQRDYLKQLVETPQTDKHMGLRFEMSRWMSAVWRKRDAEKAREGGRVSGTDWSVVLAEIGSNLFVGP